MNRRNVFRLIGLSAVGAAGFGVTGCSTIDAPPEPDGMVQSGDYRLGAGDSLRVIVFGEDQLSGEFRVDGSGTLAMPLIGEIAARNRTTREVEREIAQRLERGYVRDARVSVEVLTHRPFYILGEVRNPGQYSYTDGMTALTAVAIAGGYTYRADDGFIFVTRGSDPDKRLYRAPINTPVMPDDVVRVPERFF
ncbi:polysaccharide biosynthesis/export family protein [Azospirillum halopraeferens]|uniref:polysaccharide biosynthesis/export family protein n=1 Tax=Azospirillum halopraeferens TaxID=34010 RepID=UPI00048F2C29|nr:polysaccharide biosynthesis/export family protein [Azospirillum halopraeferens]